MQNMERRRAPCRTWNEGGHHADTWSEGEEDHGAWNAVSRAEGGRGELGNCVCAGMREKGAGADGGVNGGLGVSSSLRRKLWRILTKGVLMDVKVLQDVLALP